MSMINDVIEGYLRVARLKEASILTPSQDLKMKSLVKDISYLWEEKDTFIESMYTRLVDTFGKDITYDNLVTALIYLNKFGHGIQPEEANKVFTLSGITEANAPYSSKAGTLDDWKKLLVKFTCLGQEANLDLFHLRKYA